MLTTTTNINIINYNNFENPKNYKGGEEEESTKPILDKLEKHNLPSSTTNTIIAGNNDVVKKIVKKNTNPKPATDNNANSNNLKISGKNLNNMLSGMPGVQLMNMTMNNKTFKNVLSNPGTSEGSQGHLFTSINFNQNFKDLINIMPNANLDAAYKTFYKNKGDKYNFDIDTNAIKQSYLNNPSYRGQGVIDEAEELTREEKKKSKSLNPAIKQVNLNVKKINEMNINTQQETSPVNSKHKVVPVNSYNNYNNQNNNYKSSSPNKNLNYQGGNNSNKALNMMVVTNGYGNFNNSGNNYNSHATKNVLPSISKNQNLKKFNQMINK